MSSNGLFRTKKGFTITGNTATRDKRLSLKAKGLYLLISSYITYSEIALTKTFLLSQCAEGEKAFNSGWKELKQKGYLKVYLFSNGNSWDSEYELLDEPVGGAHTFYLNGKGEVVRTLGVIEISQDTDISAYPPKGDNARIPQNGSGAQGGSANGGDNKNHNNTKKINPKINQSINQNDREIEAETAEEILEKVEQTCTIPDSYSGDKRKIQTAIYYLTEYETYHAYSDYSDYEQSVHNLIIESLIEMATEQDIQKYANCKVSNKQVIKQIDKIIQTKADQICPLHFFVEMVMDDFIKAASVTEIKNHKRYIKSCIWSAFDSYKVKWHSDFERTYNLALLSKSGSV